MQRRLPRKWPEPKFTIRAQDAVSAQAVEAWAGLAEANGVDVETVNEARVIAEQMRMWQHDHRDLVKKADMPKGGSH